MLSRHKQYYPAEFKIKMTIPNCTLADSLLHQQVSGAGLLLIELTILHWMTKTHFSMTTKVLISFKQQILFETDILICVM